MRAALDKWIHGTGSDDARVTARVKQATAFMKDVAQSTVHQDNEGHLRLFLSQRSSLSTGAHAALKTAGILLEGAASPVSSIRSQRSGDTARPLPSLPSVDPGEPALPSPSRHTAKSSMQAGPDSTPLVRINDAQLEQVRSALNAWVDAEDRGGGTSSQMIAQATSLRWKAESSVVHQGTDGRLHLFLPKMGSLPPGLVAALKTAGIDLHEADSPVPSPPSQQFPRFARPAEGRYSPPQVVPSDLVSWPNQTSGERQPWTQHYRSKLLVWAAETSDETELGTRDHVARRIIHSMQNRTSDQNVPVNLRDIAGFANLAAAPRFPELVTHVYVPANTHPEFINLLAEQNLAVLTEDPLLSAVSVNPQGSAQVTSQPATGSNALASGSGSSPATATPVQQAWASPAFDSGNGLDDWNDVLLNWVAQVSADENKARRSEVAEHIKRWIQTRGYCQSYASCKLHKAAVHIRQIIVAARRALRRRNSYYRFSRPASI